MSLAKKVVKGGVWRTISNIIQQASSMVVNIMLARLLVPDDFGLIAMVNVFIAFVSIFTRAGFGGSIIYFREASREQISSIYWLNILLNILSYIIIFAAAPLAASFYNEPRITNLIKILSLNIMLVSLFSIHRNILERDLRFMTLAKIEIAGVLGSSVIGITSAAMGLGVYSLVLKSLSLNLLYLIFIRWKNPWAPSLVFSFTKVKEMIFYSIKYKGVGIANYFERNIDYIILGKVFNATILGYYAFAYNIMYFPVKRISYIFTQILFPTFSALKDSPQKIKKAYLKSIQLVALASFPLMTFVGLHSKSLILYVFGEKWLPVSAILAILAVAGAIQTLDQLSTTPYPALNKLNVHLSINITKLILTAGAIVVGAKFGLNGVAIAILMVKVIIFLGNLTLLSRYIKLRIREVARVLSGPISGCLLMVTLTHTLLKYVNLNSHLYTFLLHSCLILITYTVAVSLTNYKDIKFIFSTLAAKKKTISPSRA